MLINKTESEKSAANEEDPYSPEADVAALYAGVFAGADVLVREKTGISVPILETVRKFFHSRSWRGTGASDIASLSKFFGSDGRDPYWKYRYRPDDRTGFGLTIRPHPDTGFIVPELSVWDRTRYYFVRGLLGGSGFDACANLKMQTTDPALSVLPGRILSEKTLWTYSFGNGGNLRQPVVVPLQVKLISGSFEFTSEFAYIPAGKGDDELWLADGQEIGISDRNSGFGQRLEGRYLQDSRRVVWAAPYFPSSPAVSYDQATGDLDINLGVTKTHFVIPTRIHLLTYLESNLPMGIMQGRLPGIS